VRSFVTLNKADARDADAICRAMQRPETLCAHQERRATGRTGLETACELVVGARTQLMNVMSSWAPEFGFRSDRLWGCTALRARIETTDPEILQPDWQAMWRSWPTYGFLVAPMQHERAWHRAQQSANTRRRGLIRRRAGQ
jgi:hypothetical protein